MNDFFSLKRLLLSIRRLMIEKGIKMIGSISLILLVIVLFVNIKVEPGIYEEMRTMFLSLAFVFGPVLYMAVVTTEFANPSKGMATLLLPNSRFEKWLLNNVIVIGFYFLVFGLLFRLVDFWMVSRISSRFNLTADDLTILPFDTALITISILFGVVVSIGVLLGSYYFKKNSLVYSLFIMFGVLLVVLFADFMFTSYLFDGQINFGNTSPFNHVEIFDSEIPGRSYLLKTNLAPKTLAACVLIPIIALLSLTYFVRINEKQL